MTRPRYPSDERTRLRKAERRRLHGQEPRPSGQHVRLVDPDDYAHESSDVRTGP